MFYSYQSLTTAPELSAKSLAVDCYLAMFAGCTSLTTTPGLSAITLPESCYAWMFFNCTSLATIKISCTGEYNDEYFNLGVDSVAESGTFYYNGNQTAQDFGLPSGGATKRIN